MKLLHVGCGRQRLPAEIGPCEEVRMDVDREVDPDIVADMTDIPVNDGEFDAVFSSHCLEHLHRDDVHRALREFRRVLRDDGSAIVIVPDLEGLEVSLEPLYESGSGPVSAMDMIYGHMDQSSNNPYMAHRFGFTADILRACMADAGFSRTHVIKMDNRSLVGCGTR